MSNTTNYLRKKKGLPTGVILKAGGGVKYHIFYQTDEGQNKLERITGPNYFEFNDCAIDSEILISTFEQGNDWFVSPNNGLQLLEEDNSGFFRLKVTADYGEAVSFTLWRSGRQEGFYAEY